MSLSSGENIKSFNWPARRRARTAPGHAREIKQGNSNTLPSAPIDSNFTKTEDSQVSNYFHGGAPLENQAQAIMGGKKKSSGAASGIHIKPAHKGMLHADLGVPADKPIPAGKLDAAANSSDPAERKRAVFAQNAKGWNKG